MALFKRDPRRREEWRRFFASLPLAAKVHLLAGVFCIFASFALVYNLASGRELPWYQVVIWATFSGSVAVGWVLAASYTWKILFVVVPFSFVAPALSGAKFWMPGNVAGHAALPFLFFVATLVVSYVLIISFIGGEGAKSLRHRAEIALARDIHQNLVPPVHLEIGRYEIFGRSESATEVGGDLLDIVQADGATGIYVADVTGHGVPAGVMMSMIKSAVRMRTRTVAPLDVLLGDLNDVLFEVQKPGMFATFAGLHLDGERRIAFSLAGHPPLLHHRAATGTVERHEAAAPPLGVVPGFPFGASTIEPDAGDLVVVLTDGLTEVFDRAGQDFGEERFGAALAAHAKQSLPELHAALIAEVRRFGPQDDDQTLLLVRARA